MYNLYGRVAAVTGAAHGIGRGIAHRFADEGCGVAIFDIHREAAARTRDEILRTKGVRCVAMSADVRSVESVTQAIQLTEEQLGPVDIFVNNAGILRMGKVTEQSVADWDETFAINVGGAFRCTKIMMQRMIGRKRGGIINIASWFGKVGKPEFGAYCASKYAVIGLTQSAAMEGAPHGVRVNAVCPGTIVETQMRMEADEGARRTGQLTAEERAHLIPLGRTGRPDDIANVVAFLASDQASYMTGQSINVTGGLWMS